MRAEERIARLEADHADTYEERVRVIQLGNQPILDGFESWLKHSGLSEKTIKDHVDTIRFFTRYLVLSGVACKKVEWP